MSSSRFKLATFNVQNLGRLDNPDPPVYAAKMEYLVDVLRRIDADVVVVNEVREPESFDELADRLVGYTFRALGDAPPKYRAIQAGFLSRLPVRQRGQWSEFPAVLPENPGASASLPFRRPMPWLVLGLPNGETLFAVAVHLKSRRADTEELPETLGLRQAWVLGRAVSAAKRVMEAAGLRILLDDAIESNAADHYAVLGDFNDGPDSATVTTVMARDEEDLGTLEFMERRRLFPVTERIPAGRRFSYLRHGRGQMIDHILVSQRLSMGIVSAGIENQLIEGDFPGQNERGTGYPRSDHAPVWVTFELPSEKTLT